VNTRGRLVSGLVTVVMALAGFVTAGALPAAATPGTVDYVALGDSYAAGTAHGCSQSGYPALLNSERIDLTANVACSGATTSEVMSDQVPLLTPETRLVTLTVGAANLGLSAVLAACLPGPSQQCDTAIHNAQDLVRGCPIGEGTLGGDLIDLYGEVAEKAPRARIVVTGYPLLFEPPPVDRDDDQAKAIRAINEATSDLNCVIERAVAAANAADVNIHYVDVTEEFAGHGIVTLPRCTEPSDFIHNLLMCDPPPPPRADPEAFHPTAAGYSAYAEAIKTKLPGGWFDKSLT
jgi:lysophospholipase L1-like esterase